MIDSFWAECAMTSDIFDHGAAKATCHEYLRSVLPDGFARSTQNRTPKGALLAPWTYTSSELFQLERDELFHCNWMLIGHVSDFLQAGDYRTLDVGNERAIVILDVTGEFRAFHNVCRHRGSRVVSNTEGNCGRAIVCPFHGWTYELGRSAEERSTGRQIHEPLTRVRRVCCPLTLRSGKALSSCGFEATVRRSQIILNPLWNRSCLIGCPR